MFDNQAGDPYDPDTRTTLETEARKRFDNLIPPGYMDANKPDGGAGDYLLWRQILDFAERSQHPIVFVTEDRKEDWFRREQGLTVGPRPELVAEFRARSGTNIQIYSLRQFLTHAGEYQTHSVSDEAIAEVESLVDRKDYSAVFDRYRNRLVEASDAASRRRDSLRAALERSQQDLTDARDRLDRLQSVSGSNRSAPEIANLEAHRRALLEALSSERVAPAEGEDVRDAERAWDQLHRDLERIENRLAEAGRVADRVSTVNARQHLAHLERQVKSQVRRLVSAEEELATAEDELRSLPDSDWRNI